MSDLSVNFRYRQVRVHEAFDQEWHDMRAVTQSLDRPFADTDQDVVSEVFGVDVLRNADLSSFGLYAAWKVQDDRDWPVVPGSEVHALWLPRRDVVGIRYVKTGDVTFGAFTRISPFLALNAFYNKPDVWLQCQDLFRATQGK